MRNVRFIESNNKNHIGEKKLSKVITPDVVKAPMMKGPKSAPDSKEETKGESGIGGFRKVTDSVTIGTSSKAEATIVGADRRTLSGMNMALASKDKYK